MKQRYHYNVANTRVDQHVEKGNDDGLYISSVACCQELWALIMDAGTGFSSQVGHKRGRKPLEAFHYSMAALFRLQLAAAPLMQFLTVRHPCLFLNLQLLSFSSAAPVFVPQSVAAFLTAQTSLGWHSRLQLLLGCTSSRHGRPWSRLRSAAAAQMQFLTAWLPAHGCSLLTAYSPCSRRHFLADCSLACTAFTGLKPLFAQPEH